jgi:hypothetical protein
VHQVAREIGERIDQLLSIDLPDREVIDIAYPTFREHYGAPLTFLAAEVLSRVRRGQLVLIATGWPNRPLIDTEIAESDGPVGAAVLARAVHLGLGAAPVILVEQALMGPMRRIVHASGLRVLDLEAAKRCTNPSTIQAGAAILVSPVDWAEAESQAQRLVDEEDVGAFIAIEKGAANPEGNILFSRGRICTATTGKIDPLVKLCRARGIPTIGIGDGGNEMGMGNAGGVLRKRLAYGDPRHSGGIVPAQETDFVVPVTVSNWGGYGIAAALAAILGDHELLHDEATERRMLLAASLEGLIDGVTGTTATSSDGLAEDVHVAIITLLRALIGANVPASDWPGSNPTGHS